MDAVEGEAQARQVRDFGFVAFLGQGVALEHFARRRENADKFLAKFFEFVLGERALEANDEIRPDKAIGMKITIEAQNLVARLGPNSASHMTHADFLDSL